MIDGKWDATSPVPPFDPKVVLQAIDEQLDLLHRKYGEPIVRIEVGISVYMLARIPPGQPATVGEPTFAGCEVRINPAFAPDEWAPVYRARRK